MEKLAILKHFHITYSTRTIYSLMGALILQCCSAFINMADPTLRKSTGRRPLMVARRRATGYQLWRCGGMVKCVQLRFRANHPHKVYSDMRFDFILFRRLRLVRVDAYHLMNTHTCFRGSIHGSEIQSSDTENITLSL